MTLIVIALGVLLVAVTLTMLINTAELDEREEQYWERIETMEWLEEDCGKDDDLR